MHLNDQYAPYSPESGYCHIQVLNLNSDENTVLGEPTDSPADSFLISYVLGKRKKHILLDAGKKGQGAQVIVPALLAQGVERIDKLIISHMHRDHYGGIIDLLQDQRVKVDQLIYSPLPEEVIRLKNATGYETWKQLQPILHDYAAMTRLISDEDAGLRIPIDFDMFLQVVAVPNQKRINDYGINDLNIVLKLHFRRFTALFPGDCGELQAEDILESERNDSIADIFLLKAAHHGKGKSLSKPFIERCNAKIVIIPCNQHVVNRHREQFMEHLNNYGANGAKVYRMDQYREVHIFTDGMTAECWAEVGEFKEKVNFIIP